MRIAREETLLLMFDRHYDAVRRLENSCAESKVEFYWVNRLRLVVFLRDILVQNPVLG